MMQWTRRFGLVVALSFALWGCGGDEVSGAGITCPDDECESCDSDDECQAGAYCHPDEEVCALTECDEQSDCEGASFCDAEDGYCAPQVCFPGSGQCVGGEQIQYCDNLGSDYGEPRDCDSGACTDGECVCPDGESCGEVCCGAGEVCAETEVCDDDGDCELVQECRPECAGEFCGFDGELCCEGAHPVCGPHGGCAPDCSEVGELCGDDFSGCCPEGDVCIFGSCVTPGDACDDFSDCGLGEYCDDGIGKCLPDEFPDGLVCEEDVDFDPFDTGEVWRFEGIPLGDRLYRNVQSIPVTADMTGDGTPEIVISPYHEDDQHNGILAVIDGATGDPVYHNAERTFSGQGQIAVADVTGDGLPEIFAVLGAEDEGVAMVENPESCPDPEADDDDCIVWEVRSGTLDRLVGGMGPVITDLRGDGEAQLIVGAAVIDVATGDLIADGSPDSWGSSHDGHGRWGSSAVADLDGSGTLELLTGDCAWEVNFDDGELDEVWCNDDFDNGIPAVADVISEGGREGLPEVVTVRTGDLYILDGQTGETIHHIDVPGGGRGGPPNIADFDGDGTVEIGLPGRQCYTVFDVDCIDGADEPGECDQPEFPDCTPGEDCLVDPCDAAGLSDGSGEGVLWSIEVQDRSEATGSSVFDFQGNGRNEVVYNDECRLLVLDGQTGQPLISQLNTTRTATEYPLVVDVNGDGRSNIAMIANNDKYDRDCEHFLDPDSPDIRPDWFPECFPDDMDDRPEECDVGTSGIFILEDVHDAWVSTRRIWNQHAYHITNINDDATLPDQWEAPWESHNTFRANQQGERPLNSPDPVVSSMQVHSQMCPPDIEIQVTIENAGMSGIPEGMPVSLYLFEGNGEGELVATKNLGEAVSPGGMTTMVFSYEVMMSQLNQDLGFQVVANDDGDGGAPIPDCNPDDASAMVDGVMCTVQL